MRVAYIVEIYLSFVLQAIDWSYHLLIWSEAYVGWEFGTLQLLDRATSLDVTQDSLPMLLLTMPSASVIDGPWCSSCCLLRTLVHYCYCWPDKCAILFYRCWVKQYCFTHIGALLLMLMCCLSYIVIVVVMLELQGNCYRAAGVINK